MPRYDFQCDPCAYYAEITQSMDAPSTLECPVCGEQTLKKAFINAPNIFVRGEAKTVGQLAERNAKQMGFYEKQDKAIKDGIDHELRKKKKEKREQHQKIVSMTPEQQMKWIRTGDTGK